MKLPRVHRVTKGGKVYRWHRPTKTKLPDDLPESHPAFVAAWVAAEARGPAPVGRPPKPGSVRSVVQAVLQDREWRELSDLYRVESRRHLEAIMARAGDLRIAGLMPQHIEADLRELTPSVARARLKAWRKVCDQARRMQEIAVDPSLTVRAKAKPTNGFPPWTEDEIAAFRDRWPIGTSARLCFEVLFWSALRTVDAVKIGPLNLGRDGVMTLKQNKTRGDVYIPWTAPLPAWARAWSDERAVMLTCLRGDGKTFIAKEQGGPRSVKGLGTMIATRAREVGIEKSAHGLRKSRLTMAAEAGATTHAIMAWGGHKSLKEAERYTRSANMRRLVTGAEQERNDVNRA